jgi:formate-dependent nitrite reductase membrane component NrfD
MRGDWFIWMIVGLVAVGLVITLFSQLSPEAKLRRRRRKSHSRIVSRSARHSVKFSVKPPKE